MDNKDKHNNISIQLFVIASWCLVCPCPHGTKKQKSALRSITILHNSLVGHLYCLQSVHSFFDRSTICTFGAIL